MWVCVGCSSKEWSGKGAREGVVGGGLGNGCMRQHHHPNWPVTSWCLRPNVNDLEGLPGLR